MCGHPKWTHPVDAVPGLHGIALVELLSCTLDGREGTVSRDFWDILKEGRILNFTIWGWILGSLLNHYNAL
jgi:hypothetical protein